MKKFLHRAMVQLDHDTYKWLKAESLKKQISISTLIRTLILEGKNESLFQQGYDIGYEDCKNEYLKTR